MRAFGKALSPKREIFLEPLSLKLLALLDCIIRELQWQLWDDSRLSVDVALIKCRQLAIEDLEGPSIPNYLVHGKEPYKLLGT
jgi:hypothetical protein